MKANKFAQLLSLATSTKTTVDFQAAQLDVFDQLCHKTCAETSQALHNMSDTLKILSLTSSPLSATQLETLHSVQRVLEQQMKLVAKDLDKPAIEFKKQLDKLEKVINDKINKTLDAVTEPCAFNLEQIRTIVNSIKPILATCKHKVTECSFKISQTQAKGFELQGLAQRIDMPHHMQQTAKNIQQLTDNLQQLNIHLTSTPEARNQYKLDFLPLSKALIGLRLQSSCLLAEQTEDSSSLNQNVETSSSTLRLS